MKLQKLLEFDIHIERQFLKLDKLNPQQVMQWLEDNNFKEIGKGTFSKVYSTPHGKRIIKVIKKKDSAYLNFLKMALQNVRNPHLPKVYWINHYSDNDFYAVAVEKLDEVDPSFTGIDLKELDALQTFIEDIDLEDHEIEFSVHFRKQGYKRNPKASRNHQLYKTLDKVNRMGYILDLFELKNIMVRTSGNKNTLVIVDPIYSYEDLD